VTLASVACNLLGGGGVSSVWERSKQEYAEEYSSTKNEGSNLGHYRTKHFVGYTTHSHTAPDHINLAAETTFKMTKLEIRMANKEAGCGIGDVSNWVSIMSTGQNWY
jgi:hypothetical protein